MQTTVTGAPVQAAPVQAAPPSIKRTMRKSVPVLIMIGPIVIWLAVFILIPLIYIFVMSFMQKGAYGGVIFRPTFDNYARVADPLYLEIFLNSGIIAFLTTLICLLLGYPFAYIIARAPDRYKNTLVMLIMLPFWTNSLIRTYGWITILRNDGLVNNFLLGVGLIDNPLQLLYNDGAVLLGMVYALLPFMILPLYSSLEKLDHSLLEASSDLGARPYRTFLRVTLPLTFPGIFAGFIQVFVPTLSYFFISDIMGGSKAMLIGNLINNQFMTARNWPYGAALSILLIILTLVLMKLYKKAGGSMEDMA